MIPHRLTTILLAATLILAGLCAGACRRTDQQMPQIQDPPPSAPSTVAPAAPAPAAQPEIIGNATCPVSGKPVGGSAAAPSFYSDFRG